MYILCQMLSYLKKNTMSKEKNLLERLWTMGEKALEKARCQKHLNDYKDKLR